jgi:hypothetical protein
MKLGSLSRLVKSFPVYEPLADVYANINEKIENAKFHESEAEFRNNDMVA